MTACTHCITPLHHTNDTADMPLYRNSTAMCAVSAHHLQMLWSPHTHQNRDCLQSSMDRIDCQRLTYDIYQIVQEVCQLVDHLIEFDLGQCLWGLLQPAPHCVHCTQNNRVSNTGRCALCASGTMGAHTTCALFYGCCMTSPLEASFSSVFISPSVQKKGDSAKDAPERWPNIIFT